MKTALVTGGTRGIGLSTAQKFIDQGWNVYITSRKEENLEAVLSENSQLKGFVARADDLAAASETCRKIVDETGSIDVLVNNAGASAAALFEDVTDKNWEDDINLKLMSTIRMCRLAIPYMKSNNGGVIINATIGGGKAPNAGSLPTTVTRAAGINLTKSLANQYAKDQIRVNTICIGLIKSAQWDRRAESGKVDELYQEMSKKVPMGKVGEEIDYANLVAFLSSKRSAYITGTAINLDGGLCPVV